MEYLDVLNQRGELLDVRKQKSAVHRDGDWHRTVHIWCINDRREVLIQKRAADKENFPSYWDISVAGHVESGETSREGAVRELFEEIGVRETPLSFEFIGTEPQQFVLNNGTYIDNELCDIYLVKLNREVAALSMQKEELTELMWVPLAQLQKWIEEGRTDLVPHEREYATMFAKLLK